MRNFFNRATRRARRVINRTIHDELLLRTLRAQTWPATQDFSFPPHMVASSARAAINGFVAPWGDDAWLQIENEFAMVRQEIDQRRTIGGKYPEEWASRAEAQLALFALIRSTVPDVVVETGVADGGSTFAILCALDQNSRGELVSIDVAPDVGHLVADSRRHRWRLEIVGEGNQYADLAAVLSSLPMIDLFFHDSDHSYHHQTRELQAVIGRLTPGGVIACDDADHSFAFLDFCKRQGLSARFLFDGKKFLGLARSTSQP